MQKTELVSNKVFSKLKVLVLTLAIVILATSLGAGAGALLAKVAPSDEYSLAGLAAVPLWLMLEIYFEGIVEILGAYSKSIRLVTTIALLAGFYVAFYIVRQ
jgi:hypothetical protein